MWVGLVGSVGFFGSADGVGPGTRTGHGGPTLSHLSHHLHTM